LPLDKLTAKTELTLAIQTITEWIEKYNEQNCKISPCKNSVKLI